jgi:type IV pilus assembly protein PilN
MIEDEPDSTPVLRVDLSPLRQGRREAHRRRFYVLLGLCLVGSTGAMIAGQSYIDRQVRLQISQNQTLSAHIEEVGPAQGASFARPPEAEDISWLRQWLMQRSLAADTLEYLVSQTPDGVALTELKIDGPVITIRGEAQTAGAVRMFGRALSRSARWHRISRIEASAVRIERHAIQTFTFQAHTDANVTRDTQQ